MLGDPRTTRSTAALLFPSYYSLVSLWLSRIYPCFKVQHLSHFLYEIFSVPTQPQFVGDTHSERSQSGLFLLGFLYHKASLVVLGWTGSQHLSSVQWGRTDHNTQHNLLHTPGTQTTPFHSTCLENLETLPWGAQKGGRAPLEADNWEILPHLRR